MWNPLRGSDNWSEPPVWPPSDLSARKNHVAARLVIALVLAGVCGYASYAATRLPSFVGQDFRVWWLGANAVLHHRNPYTTIVYDQHPDFLYPLIAALLSVPLAGFQDTIAGPLFVTISCGVLAFLVTRTSWWPLLIFASGGMLLCIFAAQFTPLLMLGFLSTSGMWLGAVKPNIGLAMLAWRPSRKGAALMLLATAISLISMPSWPVEWLRALKLSTYHYAPVLGFGGPLILLSLLRWRRADARLLVTMALVPSSPLVYEALPLFLIARTRIESCVLALLSSVGYLAMSGFSQNEMELYMRRGRWVVVWLCYLPALIMVLRRPNEHPQPTRVGHLIGDGLNRAHCGECDSPIDHVEQTCWNCHAPIEHETPRVVLRLAYTAVAAAYLLMLYVTFFDRGA